MAKPDFLIKKDDTLPAMRITLVNPDGTRFTDLVGATLSLFFQDVEDDPAKPSSVGAGSFTVIGGTSPTGQVDYFWDAADTATIGSYRFEVEVLPSGGGRATFPGGSYGLFDVVQDLGDG